MHLSISSSEAHYRRRLSDAFVGFAAFLLLGVLIFATASEWLVRSQVLPQDTRAAHLELLESANTPHAAFGDSHVARGFDAPPGMVNLGYPSEGLELIAAKIARYYAERTPGRIILQADPHQFAPYRLGPPAVAASKRDQMPALHIASPRHRARLLAYWEAVLRNGGTLSSKVEMTTNGALLSAGDFSAIPPRKRDLHARQRLWTHRLASPGARADAEARYAAMLDELTDKGAQLCVVTFPVTAAYRAVERNQHSEAITFYESQAVRVGARYVDARAMIRDPARFRDVDHLNPSGASLFSSRIMQACFPD